MRKLIGVELTKMRYYWVIWAIALFAVGDSIAIALNNGYEPTLAFYPEAEYVIFLYATCRVFSILTVLSTAYVINEDFSMRTFQNVFSVGVSKVKYYFSRLFSQMLFVFGLYLLSCAAYVAARVLYQGSFNTAMPFGRFLAAFLIMALQLMAYVAISNMISMFCRNQFVAVAVSETWLFLALVLDAYREMGIRFFGFMTYEPLMVMQRVDDWGMSETIFTFGVFQYAVSALALTVVTGAIGYVHFIRSDT